MLDIDTSAVIGRGSHRVCYQHPSDENLCIKIDFATQTKASIREKQYYALLASRQYSWRLIPKYYGVHQTNLGLGDVFDLIRDHNGSVSKTLSHYLFQATNFAQATGSNADQLIPAFCKFKARLYFDALSTHKLHPDNIAVRDDNGSYTFVLIDDLGNSEFLPISNYLHYFAAKKVARKWARFEDLLRNNFENQALVKQLISKASECNQSSPHALN